MLNVLKTVKTYSVFFTGNILCSITVEKTIYVLEIAKTLANPFAISIERIPDIADGSS
jgi:hypothetical protein